MHAWLRNGTAVEIKLGPFVDATDGFTPETGLTISQADVRLAKNGGDWAQKSESTTLVHEENGWYRCLLDATDTATPGILVVAVNESGARPVYRTFMVIDPDMYDHLLDQASGDGFPVNVVNWDGASVQTTPPAVNVSRWNGTAVATPTVAGVPEVDVTHVAGSVVNALVGGRVDCSVGAMATSVITNAAIAANAIGASELATDAVAEIADAVWDEARAGHVAAGSFGEGVASVQGSVTGSVASVVGNVGGDVTGNIGGSLNGNVVGNVQGSVNTVTGDVQGDVVGNLGGNIIGDLLGEVAAIATGGITAGSIAADAIGSSELAASAVAEIADAVWDEAKAGHVTAGSFGEGVTVNALTTGVLSAAALAADAANKVADHVLRRTLANVAASADGDAVSFRSLLGVARKVVNRIRVSGGVLTVYEEDDTTAAGTQNVTTSASAQPITELDPP